MIDLYYWATPNGKKISIALEELALPYQVFAVNIGRGEQFKPEFLAISPNNRIPAIVDHAPADGGAPISVFESGAILLYLADKTGQLIPRDLRGRTTVLEWLMWQMGGIGPMFGQANHFVAYAPEKLPYAIDRYTNEAKRLYGVIDRRLERSKWLGCDEYSIADIATWPWLRNWKNQGIVLDDYPHLKAWFDRMEARPAVQRGVKVLADQRRQLTDDKARELLFGEAQYEKR